MENASGDGHERKARSDSALLPWLYREIDQLKVQPDFLEETSGSPHLTFLRKTLASLHFC